MRKSKKQQNRQLITILSVLSVLTIGLLSVFLLKGYIGEKMASAGDTTYYVSPTGSDTNPGSLDKPWKTFAYANSKLTSGDDLVIMAGTYSEKLLVSVSGTAANHTKISGEAGKTVTIDVNYKTNVAVEVKGSYVDISNLTVKNASNTCELLSGQYINSTNMTITGCKSHGTNATGKNINVSYHTIYNSVLENSVNTGNQGWGSGLKVQAGSDVVLENNTVYNNYGEGIGIRGTNVTVRNNFVYDNYSVNLYIDNSTNVVADSNLISCTGNSKFNRSGLRAIGIAFGIEYYSGWGNQFKDVTVKNNAVAFCDKGISYYSSEISGGGLVRTTIINNTLYGSINTALSLNYSKYTTGTVIANNLIAQPSNKLAYVPNKTGMTFKNNFWANVKPTTNAQGSGDVVGNPTFVTTPVYNNKISFKIASTSPAINKGTVVSNSNDLFGNVRPNGGAYDMGAHEY